LPSTVDELKPLFDAQDAFIKAVKPCRNGRVLMFEAAETLLDDQYVVGQSLNRATDGTQMFKDEVVS